MKKDEVLASLPFLKDLKAEKKAVEKRLKELEKIVTALDGVTLHAGFPVRVIDDGDSVEVRSGCDEAKRFALVDVKDFSVRVFKNEKDAIGKEAGQGTSLPQAIKIAKGWLAAKGAKPLETV